MKTLIDRDVRRRMLTAIEILKQKNDWLSVREIIIEFQKKYLSWYKIERRSIYADLKALEDFHWIELKQGRNNTTYAKISPVHVNLSETIQLKQLQERAFSEVK